jgi:DNA-binding beta-propeller fold protein YncE
MTSLCLRRWCQSAALALLVAIAGCAGAPQQKQVEPATAVFYPAAPDAPRIQHLTTFRGESDFDAKLSSFQQFLAGEEKGRGLVTIYGVALFEGRVFAVDSKSAGIAIFDLNKQQFSVFAGTGAGKFKVPINITIDKDGTRYVTDTGRNQVLRFDRDGGFLGAFGEPGQFRPIDAAIVGDKLYVVDLEHQEVQVLNKLTGKLLFKFGKGTSAETAMLHPTNIAIAPNGDVLVVDTGNFRIQRFSADGKLLRSFGQAGDTPGAFARPKGIAVDRSGNVYVSDAAFQNVQIFGADDQLRMAFGQPNKGEGMSLPAAVKIDYDNVALFKKYADPKFAIEYLILVTSQVAPNKVDVFGFGRMAGFDYPPGAPAKP